MKEGQLKVCKEVSCGWKCCNFGQSGHIVLFPTELENCGSLASHLKVIEEDYFGGKKVKCIANDCATCDNGYKPIMCRTYPLWVKSLANGTVLKSRKCPIARIDLSDHKDFSMNLVSRLPLRSSEIDKFLSRVYVDNYEFLQDDMNVILDESFFKTIVAIECDYLKDEEVCFASSLEDITKSLKSGCSIGKFETSKLVAYSLAYCSEYCTAYIDKCFVLPEYRGKGLQREMLQANLGYLLSKGVSDVYSMVSPKNEISLRNFEAVGFEVSKEIKYQGEYRYILKIQI